MDSQQAAMAVKVSEWIFRHLNNSLSEEDRLTLNEWRAASPANEALFLELTDTDNLKNALSLRQGFDADQAWMQLDKKHSGQTPVKRLRFLSSTLMRIAAVVVVVLSLMLVWWNRFPFEGQIMSSTEIAMDSIMPGTNRAILTLSDGRTLVLDSVSNAELSSIKEAGVSKSDGIISYHSSQESVVPVYHSITTPKGGQYRLELSDGSRVWLNAASSIRYPVQFSDSARIVDITGEVYFEVKKSTSRPFRVNVSNRGMVQVLGTSFNINAYPDEQKIKTTLFEGSVELISRTGDRVRLKPGHQAQLEDVIQVTDDINPEEIIAWKDGLFYFNRADIKTIMRQVSRWYDVEVIYEGVPDRKTFSGMVSRSNDISDVLMIMERAGVRFRISGRKVYVLNQ